MNTLDAILLAASLAAAFALLVVLFLRRPLHVLLLELCGNEARARFWTVYWAAIIVVGAVFGLLVSAPLDEGERWRETPAVPLVLTGFRASLFVVLIVLGVLAFVLLCSITILERGRASRPTPGQPAVQG